MTSSEKTLSVITAVAPHLATYLPETAASVDRLRALASSAGWTVSWVLTSDGPGLPGHYSPDVLVVPERSAGVSASRNYALGFVDTEWILSLDADDLVVPEGVLAALTDHADSEWIIGSHQVFGSNTDPTPPQEFVEIPRGELDHHLAGPFFYPNGLIARIDSVLLSGGWPATRVNEDMGLIRALSRTGPGAFSPHVIVRVRRWDRQTTAHPSFLDNALARQFQAELDRAAARAQGRQAPRTRLVELDMNGRPYPLRLSYEHYDKLP